MSAERELGMALLEDAMAPGIGIVFQHEDEVALSHPLQCLGNISLFGELLAVAVNLENHLVAARVGIGVLEVLLGRS